jgi:hypothetical protein
LKLEAKFAAEMPVTALELPDGSGPDDGPPVSVSVTLGLDHVTPDGAALTKVTWMVLVAVDPSR